MPTKAKNAKPSKIGASEHVNFAPSPDPSGQVTNTNNNVAFRQVGGTQIIVESPRAGNPQNAFYHETGRKAF